VARMVLGPHPFAVTAAGGCHRRTGRVDRHPPRQGLRDDRRGHRPADQAPPHADRLTSRPAAEPSSARRRGAPLARPPSAALLKIFSESTAAWCWGSRKDLVTRGLALRESRLCGIAGDALRAEPRAGPRTASPAGTSSQVSGPRSRSLAPRTVARRTRCRRFTNLERDIEALMPRGFTSPARAIPAGSAARRRGSCPCHGRGRPRSRPAAGRRPCAPGRPSGW
jgi:hypothetical protein